MAALCYPTEVTTTEGDSPAAVGNRIAAAILAFGLTDGSNETGGYQATDYQPVNEPLVVKESGTVMADPNRWQPLEIDNMVTQNGILLASGSQQVIGPHWGHVTGFALPDGGEDGLPAGPGRPAPAGRPGHRPGVQGLRRRGDPPEQPARSGRRGDDRHLARAPWGPTPWAPTTAPGTTSTRRPGLPYEPNLVNQADFGRALAEFWADGPKSETPPGHWNVIANERLRRRWPPTCASAAPGRWWTAWSGT